MGSAQATVNTTKDYIGYYRDNEPTPPGMRQHHRKVSEQD